MARDSWGRGGRLLRLLGTSKRLDSISDGVALKCKMGSPTPSGAVAGDSTQDTPGASQHRVRRDDEGARPIRPSARRP